MCIKSSNLSLQSYGAVYVASSRQKQMGPVPSYLWLSMWSHATLTDSTLILYKRHGISNHWHIDYLCNSLFRLTSRKTWHYWFFPPVTCGFPSQRTRKAFPFLDIIMTLKMNIRSLSQYKDVMLPVGIPMLKIRRSYDCLIFNMDIPMPGKTVFIFRLGPGHCTSHKIILWFNNTLFWFSWWILLYSHDVSIDIIQGCFTRNWGNNSHVTNLCDTEVTLQ